MKAKTTKTNTNAEAVLLLEKLAKTLGWGREVVIKEEMHNELHNALTLAIRAISNR